MSNSILGWIIFAIAVTVFLGALRVPRWLIGVLCLLAPFVVPLNFSLNSGNLSASDRQTLMYIGGAFVVVVAPITGIVGFLGACIGKKIADLMGGETPK